MISLLAMMITILLMWGVIGLFFLLAKYEKHLFHMIKKLFHSVAHLFNWNYGSPESFWDYSDYRGARLMMSFRCSGCGERQDIHEITDKLSDWEKGKF